jgi:hypothetical protein
MSKEKIKMDDGFLRTKEFLDSITGWKREQLELMLKARNISKQVVKRLESNIEEFASDWNDDLWMYTPDEIRGNLDRAIDCIREAADIYFDENSPNEEE